MAVEPVFPSGGKRLFTALAALLGWAGLTIQLYLILHLRWTVDASLLGGLINFSVSSPCSPTPWWRWC